MPLATNLQSAFTRVATEFKTVKGTIGTLSSLSTTEKSSLVGAINEIRSGQAQAGAQINDSAAGTGTVYSSSKTDSNIAAAVAALVASAPAALDTLAGSTALGGDANFATTVTTALGNRVRFDASQTLTGPQQTQARANIGAGTSNLVIGTTGGTAKDGAYQPAAANISDSTATGRAVIVAVDAAAARTAIGAGTSSLALGTTGSTAKAGNYAPAAADISNSTTVGRALIVAADAATARAAIGAGTGNGTSNVVIGTGAGQAADAAAVGNTETDFVATFNAGLL